MTRWEVDGPTNKLLWKRLGKASHLLLKNPGLSRVLDLGGGSGWFANKVREKKPSVEVHSIDLSPEDRGDGVIHTKGDILNLPFDDEYFDGMTAHAVLHHVPDDIPRAVEEAYRVLKPGSFFVIEEPGGDNLIAKFARKFFPTEKHDPGERPLSINDMVGPIKKRFEILKVEHHFLMSYLCPHVVARVPKLLKRPARGCAKVLYRCDFFLLKYLPWTRRYCAYVLVVGRRY
ncbi:MAG TPA: class I SAM-dependent methyltransferase [Euryarchaeota archaeon]|nr:class I SAM-dependent methyltransferase [Euryarchaeota archaeon]